jgi:hypothetical protein
MRFCTHVCILSFLGVGLITEDFHLLFLPSRVMDVTTGTRSVLQGGLLLFLTAKDSRVTGGATKEQAENGAFSLSGFAIACTTRFLTLLQ